ncbi:hypothetical protein AAVH_00236 [Aphelenchoides avenae]|nr:hypothetical protein AAVH_00236 [Aphelenchus avenae]
MASSGSLEGGRLSKQELEEYEAISCYIKEENNRKCDASNQYHAEKDTVQDVPRYLADLAAIHCLKGGHWIVFVNTPPAKFEQAFNYLIYAFTHKTHWPKEMHQMYFKISSDMLIASFATESTQALHFDPPFARPTGILTAELDPEPHRAMVAIDSIYDPDILGEVVIHFKPDVIRFVGTSVVSYGQPQAFQRMHHSKDVHGDTADNLPPFV